MSPDSSTLTTGTDEQLMFAVVIPTHGRPEQLRRCLRSIADLVVPNGGWEVIVVDDGTPGGVSTVTDSWSLDGVPLTLITQPNSGPAQARNRGANAARATSLAFTDDDCEPRSDWLSSLHDCLERCPDGLIGGPTVPAHDDPWLQASELIVDVLRSPSNGPVQMLPSNNLACRADRFRSIGGFDTSFPGAAGEDREFSRRWAERIGALHLCETAIVAHGRSLGAGPFWRQHAGYGRGAVQYRRRCTTAEPPVGFRFVIGLITHPLRSDTLDESLTRRIGLAARIVVAQVAVAYGSALERCRPADSSETQTELREPSRDT